MMLKIVQEPNIEKIVDNALVTRQIQLFLKREDKIHPFISGNKWRKLRYNLTEAKASGHDTLLTFGGAYSNHIYATAAAAKAAGLQAIGIIRGEEHLPLNPTLAYASDQGMHIAYMDRSTYRKKHEQTVIEALEERYGRFYLIPEGGTNNLAIKGCEEIVTAAVRTFDFICLPVGTGGTAAGVIIGMKGCGKVIGFSALKGDFLTAEVKGLLNNYQQDPPSNWSINNEYHFGGYAKTQPGLLQFIEAFYKKHQIQLEPIYTGKMMYGIYDLIQKGVFPAGSSILAIHTGGLQGLAGMKEKL